MLGFKCAKHDEELDEGNDTSQIESTLALIHCEYSFCLLHFFKNEKAEAALNEAKGLANLKIDFGGKLGKRTRF